ncbi:MAG: flagella basal body P-ring formation protein FlgA [Ignavibacteriae bacterium HGW-Ignavibacteriae-3]|nr:MAG: flagella basal body P-ring formation protein FlgA [Ignavibacteriae bacterium HGW-Ignavibacteriae-3]
MICLLSILIGFFTVQNNSLDLQLKKHLNAQFSDYAKYEYQIVQAPRSYSRIEINSEKKSRLSKNYLYVPVKIYDSKKILSLSLLTLRVKLYKKVMVATKDISRSEILNTAFFEEKLDDVSMYEGRTVSSENDLRNLRSRVLIKSGSILTVDAIEPVPVIFKGDKVTLHTGKTGVDVAVDVIARQDGCVGDVISVYSSGSKLFKGKIIDKTTIKLVE